MVGARSAAYWHASPGGATPNAPADAGGFEVSKCKPVPGFYHPIIVVGVNIGKWKKLDAKQQDVLTGTGLYLENELSADLAYTAQWDVVEKRDPVVGKKLRALTGK